MILALCGLFVSVFLLTKLFQNETKNLPPGPWGLPVFGHLFFLGSQPYITLMEWKKKYGPIIYCRFGSFPTVILQDAKLVKQAFTMPEFSGRAEIQPYIEGSQKKGILFSEGLHNTEVRQFALRNMKDFGIGKKSIESRIHEGVQELLDTIKASEGRPISSEKMTNGPVVSTLWSVLMTDKLSTDNLDKLIVITQEKINKMGPILAQLAFFMPWMDILSKVVNFGTGSLLKFKSDGFKEMYDFMGTQIAERNETRINDNPRDITDALLTKQDETSNTSSAFYGKNTHGAHMCGDLFLGGAETTSSSLEWFFNYMARHPEIQRKFQEEIDNVVGSSRLPSLLDKPKMPYADAIVYEVLRYSAVFPFGLHHRTLSDVNFHGYRIPKNTMVFANLYDIHHDKEVWGDPQNFRPERWLGGGEEVKKLKGEYFLPFSVGKRSCPGEILARDQLFLYMTTVCQRYTLTLADKNAPPPEVIEAVTRIPAPFHLVFKAREVI